MFTEKELTITTFISAAAAGAGWNWGVSWLLYAGLLFLVLALGKGVEQYMQKREDRIVERLRQRD